METSTTYTSHTQDTATASFSPDLPFHERSFSSTFDPGHQVHNYSMPRGDGDGVDGVDGLDGFPADNASSHLLSVSDEMARMFSNETTPPFLMSSSVFNYSTMGGTNMTELHPPTFTDASLTKVVIFSAMFLISLVGNVATLVQVRQCQENV